MQNCILFVGNYLVSETNSANVWQDLANQFTLEGYKVICTSKCRNKILRIIDMTSVIWLRRVDYDFAQIDIFSGQAIIWAVWSTLILKALRKPIIYTLHGGNLPQFSSRHPSLMKWLLNQANIVTSPSQYLCEQMSVYKERIEIVPNGIDISKYPYKERTKIQPNIIWLRAFHKIYDPCLAIDIISYVKKEYPTVKLIMVGPDKNDGSFEQTKKYSFDKGLNNNVEFIGPVPKQEVPHWLNEADIFLNTSAIDNTPVSVMEALACGLCVVSTNVGGIPYLLNNNHDGIIVDNRSPEKMAQSIIKLLTDGQLAGKLSKNGREKIETFDWKIIINKWLMLVNELSING